MKVRSRVESDAHVVLLRILLVVEVRRHMASVPAFFFLLAMFFIAELAAWLYARVRCGDWHLKRRVEVAKIEHRRDVASPPPTTTVLCSDGVSSENREIPIGAEDERYEA